MDRLSKPTAASLSRARKPAVVATPPPPQRKVATPSKPRASAPARMKPPVVRGKDVVAAAAAGAAVAALLEAEETVELDHTNGHAASTDGEHDFDSEMLSDSMVGSHPDIVLSDVEGHDHGEDEILTPDEGSQQDEVVEESIEVEEASGSVISESVESHSAASEHEEIEVEESAAHEEVEEPTAHEEEIVVVSPTGSVDPASNLHHADDKDQLQTGEQSPGPVAESPVKPEDDIEDIVNLLESTSFSSKAVLDTPAHVSSAEDVVKPTALLDHTEEIPDEE